MSRLVRAMIASTVDGYIADAGGGVSFLDPFTDGYDGWDEFYASVGSIVMGRATYDWTVRLGFWPYEDRRCAVLTSSPLAEGIAGVAAADSPKAALAALTETDGDVWIMGGGRTIRAFEEAGLLDRLELTLVPVRLGAGTPLFPPGGPCVQSLRLTKHEARPMGMIDLWYEPVHTAAE